MFKDGCGFVMGAAVLAALAGCGQASSPGAAGLLESCPVAGQIASQGLMSPDELWALEEQMVGLGPRHTGSPAHKAWLDILESHLRESGLRVERLPGQMAQRWDHKRWSLKLVEGATETEVPVASFFPYSGRTPPGGVTADFADAGLGTPADFQNGDFAGKIALVEEPIAPLTIGALFYPVLAYQHDPDLTITAATDYTRAWSSILNPQNSVVSPQTGSLTAAHAAGAAGVIIALDLSADNAAGQYTPLWWNPEGQEVPALFVDRDTGVMLKQRIGSGAKLRLELRVDVYPNESVDELVATLPGMNADEIVIVNTHTDGPSASEENGTIGLLALARYFASLPQSCRQRTLYFIFEPAHFHYNVNVAHSHEPVLDKAVASLTMEHLGQMEWVDDSLGYHPTGQIEPAAMFCSETPLLSLAIGAVTAEDLRRTLVLRPYGGYIYFGVGSWLHQAGVPNCSYISGPNALLSYANNQHLDKTDRNRMHREVRTGIRLVSQIDATPAEIMAIGDTALLGPLN